MKTLMMTAAIALGFAVPAFADSAAEDVAKHDFDTSFVTDRTLGKTSPAEIHGLKGVENGDVISTQNMYALRILGADSPAEIAAAK